MVTFLIILLIGVPAIVFHEWAHGWVAYRMGDPTAKRLGRLTLNPIKHIDLVGTILCPLGLYLLYAFGVTPSLVLFGWAKPVPVNFAALSNPKRDKIWVALAGPGTNIVLAFLLAQVVRSGLLPQMLAEGFVYAVALNVGLAVFNLLPIPPLDGSRVVSGLIPDEWDRVYSKIEPYGIVVIIIMMNLGWLRIIKPIVFLVSLLLGL